MIFDILEISSSILRHPIPITYCKLCIPEIHVWLVNTDQLRLLVELLFPIVRGAES